jgi:hypothetical protein
MNFFVAVTDYDWFLLHASKPSVEEVNFSFLRIEKPAAKRKLLNQHKPGLSFARTMSV